MTLQNRRKSKRTASLPPHALLWQSEERNEPASIFLFFAATKAGVFMGVILWHERVCVLDIDTQQQTS